MDNDTLPPLALSEADVSVGSTVETLWNDRRYRVTITGESRTHWSVDWHSTRLKVPKTRRPEREHPGYRDVYQGQGGAVQVFLTEQAIVDHAFLQAHRHALAHAVRLSVDAELLRKVQALLAGKL